MTKRERTFDFMPKTALSPKPAFGKAVVKVKAIEMAKPQAAVDAEEEKIFERDLEQLMTIISAFGACAPEATAQTDERIRNMMLSLGSNAYAKDKSKLDAQQVANRKKPAAEMRIKTRKSHSSGHKTLRHEFKARRPAAAAKLLQTETGVVPVTFLAGVAYGLDGRPVQQASNYRCPQPAPPVLLL